MNERRIRLIKDGGPEHEGPVLYWMSRDQRVKDNWALLFAQGLALERKKPLGVLFCLVPQFLGATSRQYTFMLEGLREAEQSLAKANVAFFLLTGTPEKEIPRFVAQHEVGTLVTDFDPLRVKRAWRQLVADKVKIAFYEADAHNIVPCWLASPKAEIGARTLRPKISRLLPEFLEPFPRFKKHPFPWKREPMPVDWEAVARIVRADPTSPVKWIKPGAAEAARKLRLFIERKLVSYDEGRNDPSRDSVSHLSAYLHFGQISAQRVALEVSKAPLPMTIKEAFLEQLIVRRELADNFCYYNEQYDSFEGFPGWAQKTLRDHAKDPRPYLYTREQLEHAQTHDQLWNAAQLEMKSHGKMHGYMRMYWAKKILEWTRHPREALEIAIYLNDRYELDGRDPNGYTGIAWSIGGVHDRPWPERPIFGKIRYMSYNGCKSKFDVKAYIESVQQSG
ncbi:MAG TPA: deoxyribodipyrimidine photo-lyase [Syntrophorhabdales bacterium]|nr:deoxyribodipyrimidine photo-lyase [Syntrophorhabdales bacterium]